MTLQNFHISVNKDEVDCSVYSQGDNLEFLDFIKVRYETIKFIEKNYPDSKIVTSWWEIGWEITTPEFGFVSKPLKLKMFEEQKIHDLNKDDLFLYPPFHTRETLKRYQEVYNMKLLKKFEVNGKYLELYIIEGKK
jgi:hypothetical protein